MIEEAYDEDYEQAYGEDAPEGYEEYGEEESDEETEPESDEDAEPDEETLRKLQKKERRKEIRHILLGNFVVFEDGSYGAGNGAWVTPFGFSDGAQGTILFGAREKQYRYGAKMSNSTKVMYQVLNLMKKKIGRRLILATAPEAAVCYVKSILFRPVILLFEEAEEDGSSMEFVLHAYCSRGLFSFFAISHAVKKLDNALPKQIFRLENKAPQRTERQ